MPAADADLYWMQRALKLAQHAESEGEVPVGAVVVANGELLGEGWNAPVARHDPTAHAEIRAIRAAAERSENYRIPGTTLYVTLEPCPMCAGAIIQARIERVVFGASDPRAGAVESQFQLLQHPQLNHHCEVHSGVLAEPCGELLKQFFRKRRGQRPAKEEGRDG